MSTEFAKTAKALAENPELLAQLCSTDSAEKRANMLSEAGLTVPTPADVDAHLASMIGVSGGLDASPTPTASQSRKEQELLGSITVTMNQVYGGGQADSGSQSGSSDVDQTTSTAAQIAAQIALAMSMPTQPGPGWTVAT